MKRFLLIFLVLATYAVSAMAQKRFSQLSDGDMFPDIMLRTIDDELLTSENLRGKVVFYNFYFARCSPCISQKSVLNELYEKFHTDDVVFISLTSDNYETTRKFRDKHGIKFKVVSMTKEESLNFAASSFPTNILVGTDGKIVLKITGGGSKEREIRIRDSFSSAIQNEIQK